MDWGGMEKSSLHSASFSLFCRLHFFQTGTHREGGQLGLPLLDSFSRFSEGLMLFACNKVAGGEITSQLKPGPFCCTNSYDSP